MFRSRKIAHERRVLATCARSCRRIGVASGRFVVAVSGGPDSLSLADLLYRLSGDLDLELVLAYVDHRLRGPKASRGERRVISRFARERGLALDVRELSRAHTLEDRDGLEAAARTRRYRKLFEAVSEHDAGGLIVAHHLSDQVETVLMRLVAGTTVEGAAGMRERSVREGTAILRPLLGIAGADLRRYAKYRRLRPVFDRTNRDRYRLRSRIRIDLLPVIARVRAGALESIARSAASMAEESDALAMVTAERDPFVSASPAGRRAPALFADRRAFFSLPVALRLRSLHRAVSSVSSAPDYRIPRRFFEPLLGDDAYSSRARVAVGYGVELLLDGERLWVVRPNVVPGAKTQYLEVVDVEGRVLRARLPEPFSDVRVSIASTADRPLASIAYPFGKSEEPCHQDGRGRSEQVCFSCILPVRARPATPGDGTAFGFTRGGFKRAMQADGRARMVLADNAGNRALLVRHSADRIVLLEGPQASTGMPVCLCFDVRCDRFERGASEHEPER
ncbi:MAG: tRNA lysidine(34) synthetase TilS [Spirochaetales bacterium]